MDVFRACRLLCAAVAVFFVHQTIVAQPYARTFVSAQRGSDANSCTPVDPCRTFAHAMTNTAANGELIVLDSGGYGSFNITQPVQVEAPAGVYAGVTASSGSAIHVMAVGAGVIKLKGLTLNSTGATQGIWQTSALYLYLENLSVTGFGTAATGTGGLVLGSASNVFMSDCTFRRNQNGLYSHVYPDTIRITVQRSAFVHSINAGVWFDQAGYIVVNDSVIDGGTYGLATEGVQSKAMIERCVVAHTGTALYANNDSRIRLSDSTVTDNGTAFTGINSGTLLSRSNNTLADNTDDPSGTIVPYNGQ